MTAAILSTENQAWGFWGNMSRLETATPVDTGAAWELAYAAIGEATGLDTNAIRAFLDSRHGRHFADDVANEIVGGRALAEAIAAATARWMNWSISRRTSRQTGIPAGLPYLTGFAMHAEIEAEAEAAD